MVREDCFVQRVSRIYLEVTGVGTEVWSSGPEPGSTPPPPPKTRKVRLELRLLEAKGH